MLRLMINGIKADTYQDDPIQVKMQFTDVQNINATKASHTQSFRLPLTDVNQSIFGAVGSPTSVTAIMDVKQRMEAELYDESLLLLKGYIQVKRFIQQKRKYMDVEVTFFGEVADLSRAIGDGLLSDLDFSALNTPQTNAVMTASWVGSKDLRFGVVDRGQNWSGEDTFQTLNTEMKPWRMTGFLRARHIVDKMMEAAGVTYESNFLSGMDDLYLMCLNDGDIFNSGTSQLPDARFHVGLTSNVLCSGTLFAAIPYVETGSYFDRGSHYASSTFTAPYDGLYTFYVRTIFATTLSSGTYRSSVFVNNVETSNLLNLSSGALSAGFQYLQEVTLSLFASDSVQVRQRTSGSSSIVTVQGTGNLTTPTTSWELYQFYPTSLNFGVSNNLPVMKQIDFLQGLQKMFNLVFIPDKYRPTHYYIEPLADYVQTGATLDWSGKVDYSKDVEIKPTTDLQAREYMWTMQAGQDFIGQAVRDTFQRNYGEWKVRDPSNDFAVGEQAVESPFASFTISLIPQTDFPILRLVDAAGESIEEPLPRLAFWNGTIAVDWQMNGATLTDFPVFSDMSDLNVDINTEDLNYGYERKFRYIVANSLNSLYYKYWHPLVGSLYSSNARIVTLYVRLQPFEVLQTEWADTILIAGDAYRALSIEYVANEPDELVKVVLLRIVAPFRLCAQVPDLIDKDGRVRFVSATGFSQYAVSRECCELFGHVHDGSTFYCYGNDPLS